MGWLLLAVLGCCALLSSCGEQAQEKEDTVSKDTLPVLPPTPDIIEVPGGNSSSSSDPNDLPTDELKNGQYYFIRPMIYCDPFGWKQYWKERLNLLKDGNKILPSHLQSDLFPKPDNKHWFELNWSISDDEFASVEGWNEEKIATVIKKENPYLFNAHQLRYPNELPINKYIWKLCTTAPFEFSGNTGNYEAPILAYDQMRGKSEHTLNPAVVLATLATEQNYCRSSRFHSETEAEKIQSTYNLYCRCMGVGLAGKPNDSANQLFAGIRLYVMYFYVGCYLRELGFFNIENYITNVDGSYRTEKFYNFSKYNNNFSPQVGKVSFYCKFNYMSNEPSFGYGFQANVNGQSGAWVADSMAGYENCLEWIDQLKNGKYKGLDESDAYYLDGFPFLPSGAAVFARLQGYNPWLYYPGSKQKTSYMGGMNTQKWIDDFLEIYASIRDFK